MPVSLLYVLGEKSLSFAMFRAVQCKWLRSLAEEGLQCDFSVNDSNEHNKKLLQWKHSPMERTVAGKS